MDTEERLFELLYERETKLNKYLEGNSANATEFKSWYLANLAKIEKEIVCLANKVYSIEAKSVREVFTHIFDEIKAEDNQLGDEEVLQIVSNKIQEAGQKKKAFEPKFFLFGKEPPEYKLPKEIVQSIQFVARSTGLTDEEILQGKPFRVRIVTNEPDECSPKDKGTDDGFSR